ncbi:MAG: transposase [Dehalococcoidia bacterium]
MRKTFKYRLYPSPAQARALDAQLKEARTLYNAALQERRDAWRRGVSLNYYDQANQLKEIRAAGDLSLANFSACQDVLRRVDKTFKAFYRRVKRGEKAGYPRFKPRQRFDSFTFPAYGDGCGLSGRRVRVQGVGLIKVKLHRAVRGVVKTVTLKREAGYWYACFSVECGLALLSESRDAIGIDVGLESFAALSNGAAIPNPRHYGEGLSDLRVAQRKVARRKKGGRGRRKTVLLLQKAHMHIRNQRSDFHHKLARQLVNRYGLIALEDLNVKGLAGGMLAKSVHDAGWASFAQKLSYKAEETGRKLVFVNPNGTSQRCVCGAAVPKALKDRWHHCRACGLSVPRDQASAMEILRLGWSLAGITWPGEACVPAEAVCFS